jgi:hypothetical protein
MERTMADDTVVDHTGEIVDLKVKVCRLNRSITKREREIVICQEEIEDLKIDLDLAKGKLAQLGVPDYDGDEEDED